MANSLKRVSSLALLPLIAACASTATSPPSSTGSTSGTAVIRPTRPSTPPPQYVPPPSSSTGQFRAPRVMNIPGLEGVIGRNGDALQSLFGTPRLDVHEGDARKLQFTGEACVLDIYLYPLSPGAEPTATYVDARRASDGLDVDRASCVRALSR